MKVRESGMPDRGMWEKFFDPCKIIIQMGLDSQVRDVVEVGCGYGTFTISVAKVISGQIHAYDIDEEMIHITQAEAEKAKLNNVNAVLRDIIADGTGLPDESVDYVMLFNILHLETPELLLKEANRILRSGGKLGIIHWNYDPSTPRGPSMEIRPKPKACIRWAEQVGFHSPKRYDLKPYHYGIVLTK
ncbi:MAG: methyltransferase type 11 [Omnitrophica bacterium RIFCSPLOWO2_12_FULL_44_17]|uniref:Methyltransferase type 11 n=1 Tax=Candidatus Danuiimicrobium aquiferis TaxID=1801832 RepID=A0A1G1KYV0_9BACT|nr:MAG: methyltransferase type 11 [Omnitrophica bacterium RIFCSPHIGHO2_02_FULL_45_28]OGW92142.1 MAG: methyltransferase type 11 [Omnitrophica bacterium RIFCSPHIGHO2_12_FULL_44_12]OGW98080.1 MAG: methyltransferase type 11 [Omnitrophica bacterium RIFCSPLOWO2_12_FULL_44_17]OGX03478.1 MAG: methyltransferase type 11 [Omnitrophica bacterium RIFCSPLOWO2_02_FULL_44_11]